MNHNSLLYKFLFVVVMITVTLLGGALGLAHRSLSNGSINSFVSFAPKPAEDPYYGNLPKTESTPTVDAQKESVTGNQIFTQSFKRTSGEDVPSLPLQSALVADFQSGKTYFEFNPDKRWPLASITKLMTAAVTEKLIDPNQKIMLTDSDFLPDDDSVRILRPGETFTVRDILRPLLLFSSNEAAEALANSRGRANFIAEMNAVAKEWGMSSTYFGDPSGLSVTNQSTASDLLKMAAKIYGLYPEIFNITARKSAVVTDLNSQAPVKIASINNFAGWQDFLGGKTGYTDEAGGNLLSIFSYKGRPVAIIVLGTEDRFGDTEKLLSWFKDNFVLNL